MLLQKLDKAISAGTVRAFADDTAAVSDDIIRDLGNIGTVFDEFSKISGLKLNMPKTKIIHLGNKSYSEKEIQHRFPEWIGAQIVGCAKYLGVEIGPERGDSVWEDAEEKWSKRAAKWGQEPIGLYFHSLCYTVFCCSVLGFLAQLQELPTTIVTRQNNSPNHRKRTEPFVYPYGPVRHQKTPGRSRPLREPGRARSGG